MTQIYPARAADISLTTGSGSFSVSGLAPAENMRTFNEVMQIGDTIYLGVAHREKNEWEEGLYTYVGIDRFIRSQIYQSSAGGAPVNFSAGIKDVWVTMPARTIQLADENVFHGGIVEINFGAGSTETSLTITDSFIAADSFVAAQIVAIATADHTVEDHWTDAPIVIAGNIVAGVSFTIFAKARGASLTGKYSVSWTWK